MQCLANLTTETVATHGGAEALGDCHPNEHRSSAMQASNDDPSSLAPLSSLRQLLEVTAAGQRRDPRRHAQAESRALPFARRARRIALPARVDIRALNPCLRFLRRLLGWKVLFISDTPYELDPSSLAPMREVGLPTAEQDFSFFPMGHPEPIYDEALPSQPAGFHR